MPKITCKCLKLSSDTWLLGFVAIVFAGVTYLSIAIGNNEGPPAPDSGNDTALGNDTAPVNDTALGIASIDNQIIDALISARLLKFD